MFNEFMFVGDPHGKYEHIMDSIQAKPPSAAVLLGDMCFEEPIEQCFNMLDQTKLHWIHGNHDTDKQLWFDNIFHSPWKVKNIHGRMESIEGLRIAGLGGVFRGKIWNPKSEEPRYNTRMEWQKAHSHKRFAQTYKAGVRKHESTIWPEDYYCLMKLHADILVLHEAPTSDRHGFKALDDLAVELGVRLIVHGHHHRCYCETLENGIAVVGLGLAQIVRMNITSFQRAMTNEDIFNAFEF